MMVAYWLLQLFMQITAITSEKSSNAFTTNGVPDEILSKEEADSFKKKHNLLMDRDLKVQKISDEMTLSHNGKTYELEGDPIQDIFTPDATLLFDGKPAKQPFINILQKKNEDETVTIVKKPNGEITNVIIFDTKNGDSVELVSVLPQSNLLATISADDKDQEEIDKKFQYGEDAVGGWLSEPKSVAAIPAEAVAVTCSSYRNIELAVAYDSSFCSKHGDKDASDTAAVAIVEAVSQWYQQVGLCVKVSISHMEGYCDSTSDPYKDYIDLNASGCGDAGLLQGFQTYWNDNRNDVHRDTAHLFSGTGLECYSDGSCVVGCAFTGTTCKLDAAYGVNYATFSNDVTSRSILVAHELGHNNGAGHVTTYDYIMYPSINPSENGFSQTSINAFETVFGSTTCVGLAAPPGPTTSPSAKPSVTPGVCGNSKCEFNAGESCHSCPNDCSESEACGTLGLSPYGVTLYRGSSIYGIMFDVQAKKNVQIYGFDVLVSQSDVVNVKVYAKEGTYQGSENLSSSWKLVFDGSVTPVPIDSFDIIYCYATVILDSVVSVDGGASSGIYVVLNEGYRLFYLINASVGDTVSSNDDLSILAGSRSYSSDFTSFVPGYKYTGLIKYMQIDSSDSPSNFPADSSMPSSSPSLRPTITDASQSPSVHTSDNPSASPTYLFSSSPSSLPSTLPSISPTRFFSAVPSSSPSTSPSTSPIQSFSSSPSSLPSTFPSTSPIQSFSAVPSSSPSTSPSTSPIQSFSSSPSRSPNIDLSTLPSQNPTDPSLTGSDVPSLAPSKPIKKVVIVISCSCRLNGLSLADLIAVVLRALEIAFARASGVKRCRITSFGSRRSLLSTSSPEVFFDLIDDKECDDTGDCDAAMDQGLEDAKAATETLTKTVTDGSIGTYLSDAAAELSAPVLDTVSVDADSLVAKEPVLEIVTGSPTEAPTTKELSLLDSFFEILRSILDFLSVLLDSIAGLL